MDEPRRQCRPPARSARGCSRCSSHVRGQVNTFSATPTGARRAARGETTARRDAAGGLAPRRGGPRRCGRQTVKGSLGVSAGRHAASRGGEGARGHVRSAASLDGARPRRRRRNRKHLAAPARAWTPRLYARSVARGGERGDAGRRGQRGGTPPPPRRWGPRRRRSRRAPAARRRSSADFIGSKGLRMTPAAPTPTTRRPPRRGRGRS